MIKRSERSFSSLAVLICAILVELAFKWRCSSWTGTSSHSIKSLGQGLTVDNASASGMFFPCTYLISASYFWTLSIILPIRGGPVERCFLKIASDGLWSVSQWHLFHIRSNGTSEGHVLRLAFVLRYLNSEILCLSRACFFIQWGPCFGARLHQGRVRTHVLSKYW